MAKAPLSAPPPAAPAPAPAAPPAPPAAAPGSPAVAAPTDPAPQTASGAPASNDLTPHVEGGTSPQEVAASGVVPTPPVAPAPPPNGTAQEGVPVVGDEDFNGTSNLGDWDGDGRPGGAAPPQGSHDELFAAPAAPEDKEPADMSPAELGSYMAERDNGDFYDDRELDALRDRGQEMVNGRKLDDAFIVAYRAKRDELNEQAEIDGMSDDDRLRRLERAAGLRSPS